MKIRLTVIVLLLPVLLFAQQKTTSNFDKPSRKVFLWDVTLSMKGAGGCPNIWDEVKDKLIKEVENISDPKTEVVILPFQHRIIDKISDYATPEGKQKLIQYVKSFDLPRLWIGDAINGREVNSGEKGKTTMTKLYAPLQECLATVISNDKTDILVILTDGVSDFPADAEAFKDFVCNKWCGSIAEEKDIFAFYVELTQNAINESLCPCPRFKIVDPDDGGDINISTIKLTPSRSVVYNVKDDYGKEIVVKFDAESTTKIEEGFIVHVKSDNNPYFNIDQEVVLDPIRNVVHIKPNEKIDFNSMRQLILSQDDNKGYAHLSFTPGAGMSEKYNRVAISEIETEIEIVGIDERVLKLEWK